MAQIEIEGKKYKVTEGLGFIHSVGMYAKMVNVAGKEKMIVRPQGAKSYRFWTTEERCKPLRDYLQNEREYNAKLTGKCL